MRHIEWREGSVSRDIEEIKAFAAQFWPQTVQAQTFGVPFNLFDDLFLHGENTGSVGVLLGRCPGTGALVGIYVALITPWIHSQNFIHSDEVVWFIHKRYMTKTHLKHFLAEVEQANKRWGVDYFNITLHDIGDIESGRNLFESQGYKMTNLSFMKGV